MSTAAYPVETVEQLRAELAALCVARAFGETVHDAVLEMVYDQNSDVKWIDIDLDALMVKQ